MKIRGHITKTRDGKWYTPVATVEIAGEEKRYFKGDKCERLSKARYDMRKLKQFAKITVTMKKDAVAVVPIMTPKAHSLWARVKAAVFGNSGAA